MNAGATPSITSEEMLTDPKIPPPGPQRKNSMYHPSYHHLPPAQAQGSTKHWNHEQLTSASHLLLLSPKTTRGLPWWL